MNENLYTMKQNRYPNGYLPKIAYHIAQSNYDKVEYFLNQQTRRYGELTILDMTFILNAIVDMGAEAQARQWVNMMKWKQQES